MKSEYEWKSPYKSPARERYLNDPTFHALVDMLYAMLMREEGKYTPTELREAVMLAATMYETLNIRPLIIDRRGGEAE